MEFYVNKKKEYEKKAEEAANSKNFKLASEYIAKAAQFGFDLAEKTSGKIRVAYTDDAHGLVDLAERFKLEAEKTQSTKEKSAETVGDSAQGEGSSFKLKSRPTQRLSDVAGLEEVKQILMDDVILPFKHPYIYDRYGLKPGTGVLMYGPPGNGKTYIAKAIAGELDAEFFNVRGSSIKNKYVGETEKNMRRLFEEARQFDRAVIFFDDVDSILAERRTDQKVNAVEEFLTSADGLEENDNCLLLLASTNRPWDLDKAVTRHGRLGQHIYVGLPDIDAKKAILLHHLRCPLNEDIHQELDNIADALEGYSGADIEAVCKKARLYSVHEDLSTGEEGEVDASKIYAAIEVVKPTVSQESIAKYEKWGSQGFAENGVD